MLCVCIGYQAFAFVVGDFDMLSLCQLPLCVQWQESMASIQIVEQVFYLMPHKLYETMIMETPDNYRGRTLLLGLIVSFLLYCLTYYSTPLSVLSYNRTRLYPYLVVHVSI